MTSIALAPANGASAALAAQMGYSPEQLDLITNTVAKGATPLELQMFLTYARRTGLDPIARQIHFVARRDGGTIQVGIDGYRLMAERTGLYAGNDDPVFDGSTKDGYPAKAIVTVWKLVAGTRCPFTASARWEEYAPYYKDGLGTMWKKMPHNMLGKCAEAAALRKAFPAELSGVYTSEEMQQADVLPAAAMPAAAAHVNTATGEIIDAEPTLTPRQQKQLAARALYAAEGWTAGADKEKGRALLSQLLEREITKENAGELTVEDYDAARVELEQRAHWRKMYFVTAAGMNDEESRAQCAQILGIPVETRANLTAAQWKQVYEHLSSGGGEDDPFGD